MAWDVDSLQESLLIGSTLVEGSTLSEQEAQAVLAGRTVVGHPISEIRELSDYRAAVEHLIAELRVSPFLSLDLIHAFHRRLFHGVSGDAGIWKGHRNFTLRSDGSRHEYTHPSAVDEAMRDWLERFLHLSETDAARGAASLYYGFQDIHPFADGNGRIGRVLIAYWLHWKWHLSFSFYLSDKLEHLDALERANLGDLGDLAEFFRKRVREES